MKIIYLTGLPLIRYGFVHATGLPTRQGYSLEEDHRIGAYPTSVGRYELNNGVMVIHTVDGEVWIRHMSDNMATSTPEFESLLRQLCPNGKGVFGPFSNGEDVPSYMLLIRISNPYWIGNNGEYRFKVPADQINDV